MNFLAHIFLSGDNHDLILGNLIADAVKGNQDGQFRKDILRGIQLHRAIDSFTDQHPCVIQSKLRLREEFHKYAGVIADMLYDHFLAKHWNDYSKVSLPVSAAQTYMILTNNYNILPDRTKIIMPYMINNNWLVSYAVLDNMQRHFEGMARRTTSRSSFDSGMERAVEMIRPDYKLFEKEFREFFPDVMEFSNNFIKNQ